MQNTRDSLNKPTSPTCWIITEGMVGTENQCVGIASAIGLFPIIIKIGLRQPWKALSPWLGFEISQSFTPLLSAPWPDIVIASGRKSIAASRYIKRMSKGKTFTIQIQDPKISPSNFDLVAVPHHDDVRGGNVIVTHGAPNKITQEKLNEAKIQFAPLFEKMPSPRVAVLIGGNSKTHQLTSDITANFTSQLSKLNASLMVTASRRTGEENLKTIQSTLSNDRNFIWDGSSDENPYLGMLAWADHIIVTEDTVSMMSDAATTGKPVSVIKLEGHSKRFDRFHKHFEDIGVSRPFTGNLEDWTYEPINDAQLVADVIKEKWG